MKVYELVDYLKSLPQDYEVIDERFCINACELYTIIHVDNNCKEVVFL